MAEYYVDNVAGDDNANGTIGSPWETFSESCAKLIAGDTLNIVDNGADTPYREGLWPIVGGTYQGPVDGLAHIVGSFDVSGLSWADVGGTWQAASAAVTSRLYTCSDADWTSAGVFAPEKRTKAVDVGSIGTGEWFYDAGTLYYKPTAGEVFGATHIESAVDSSPVTIRVDNTTVNRVSVSLAGISKSGFALTGCSNILISNCNSKHAYNGVSAGGGGGDSITVEDCTITDCENNGIIFAGSVVPLNDTIIRRCTISRIEGNDCITLHKDGSNNDIGSTHLIEDCNLSFAAEQGLDIATGSFVTARNNTTHHNHSAGIVIGGTTTNNVLITGHYSYDDGDSVGGIIIGPSDTVRLTDSIFKNSFSRQVRVGHAVNLTVDNCAFILGADGMRVFIDILGGGTNVQFNDNMFTQESVGDAPKYARFINFSPDVNTSSFSGNQWYPPGSALGPYSVEGADYTASELTDSFGVAIDDTFLTEPALSAPQNEPSATGNEAACVSTVPKGAMYVYAKTTPFTGSGAENAAEIIALGASKTAGLENTATLDGQAGGTLYHLGWAQDTAVPSITNLISTPTGGDVTLTWDTDILSDSGVSWGSTLAYEQTPEYVATPTLSHSVVISGLTEGETYYWRATSVDAAGGSSDSPRQEGIAGTATAPMSLNFDMTANDTLEIVAGNVAGVGYNATIAWGDGDETSVLASGTFSHLCLETRTYTVIISGTFPHLDSASNPSILKLSAINNLGTVGARSYANSFNGATNLTSITIGIVDATQVTSAFRAFLNCTGMVDASSMVMPDLPACTSMQEMLRGWTNVVNEPDTSAMVCAANTSLEQLCYAWGGATFPDWSNLSTGEVVSIASAFNASAATSPPLVGGWDTSKIANGANALRSLSAAGEMTIPGLESWDIEAFSVLANFMNGSTLATPAYDDVLAGWSVQDPNPALLIHFGNSKYSTAAAADHALLASKVTTLSDGGPE